MIIRNGTIYDAIHRQPYQADIAVRDGKIAAIQEHLPAADGEAEFDASGRSVYPGFVEAHSHMGLDPYGAGFEHKDYNETTDPIESYLRGMDSFNPMDEAVHMALEGGVTTVCTGPGSSNILGGTFCAVKTYGRCVDHMVVKANAAMKCAFGENPKRAYMKNGCSARMTVTAKLRDMLYQTMDYMARKEAAGDDPLKRPKFDMKLESLIPVVKGEMPLKAHAHRADDICSAIRVAKEFGIKLTIEHCTEGHLIVDELVEAGYPVAVGPTMVNASKWELRNRTFTTPGILAAAGCQVSIITDAPCILQQYLPLCAGLAVKAGMDPFAALQSITINPAKHIGIADRVGSIEVGKDADLVITDGDPMVSSTSVLSVFVNGQKVVG